MPGSVSEGRSRTTAEHWQRIVDVNIMGVVNGIAPRTRHDPAGRWAHREHRITGGAGPEPHARALRHDQTRGGRTVPEFAPGGSPTRRTGHRPVSRSDGETPILDSKGPEGLPRTTCSPPGTC